jgi:hypothetical protein
MFDHLRNFPWFAEKYDPAPEFQALRTRVRKEGWKGRLDTFLLDLESGKFDPHLTEPESEDLSPVKENAANGETTAVNDSNIGPFTNGVLYTPDVASKPDRLAKDLRQAKALVSILEAEAATLRKAKVKKPQPKDDHIIEDGRESTDMIAGIMEEDEPEPKENGSDAVERRIEKIMTDLREQGHVDGNDKNAYEARKVLCYSHPTASL